VEGIGARDSLLRVGVRYGDHLLWVGLAFALSGDGVRTYLGKFPVWLLKYVFKPLKIWLIQAPISRFCLPSVPRNGGRPPQSRKLQVESQ
jgi:hypothetical protein